MKIFDSTFFFKSHRFIYYTTEQGQRFLDRLELERENQEEHNAKEDDVAMVFLTSGTTGLPKLAAHTQRGIMADAVNGMVTSGVFMLNSLN